MDPGENVARNVAVENNREQGYATTLLKAMEDCHALGTHLIPGSVTSKNVAKITKARNIAKRRRTKENARRIKLRKSARKSVVLAHLMFVHLKN